VINGGMRRGERGGGGGGGGGGGRNEGRRMRGVRTQANPPNVVTTAYFN